MLSLNDFSHHGPWTTSTLGASRNSDTARLGEPPVDTREMKYPESLWRGRQKQMAFFT